MQLCLNFLINIPITTCFRHKSVAFRAPVDFCL